MFAIESVDEDLILASKNGQRLRVRFMSPSIVRVTYTQGRSFKDTRSRIVTMDSAFCETEVRDDLESVEIATALLCVRIDKLTGSLSYFDHVRKLLVREPERGGKWLTKKPVYRSLFDRDRSATAGLNIDGARAEAKPDQVVFNRDAFEAKLEFVFSQDEALFGLGSHEEGYGNLRGRNRELYQQNMKAVVPFFVSTRGYGVLFDCSSLMTFHDDALGSYLWADVVDELDYYVIQGDRYDDITCGYHKLTGKAPMLPKWALGYVQSKERYVNAQELIDVVNEYRRRRIPLDCIVLDWKSWPNGAGWGQKSFDPSRFPSPTAMTTSLHAMGAKLMVSIWPIMTGGCPNQSELLEKNMMLGNQATYNAFDAEARACYWKQAKEGLFDQGVDAWWCDCTEPFESDWKGAVKPEAHERLILNTSQSKLYLDPADINAYSLMHSRGIYEGQRSATENKRVVNLTRSSYAGQHRYGTVTWNGDICGTWETFRRCIPEGLNFCATGEPYWTVDIGGFFVDYDPKFWFWHGDHSDGCRRLTGMNAMEPDPNDTGCRDLGYWELYTRWVQYATFLPMFRSHGTDASREIWRFGEEGTRYYDTIASFIRLRYRLMPYIYSLAASVTRKGTMMMRALALEFPLDTFTHNVDDQYMFGPSLMVCPVTSAMYFESNSRPIDNAKQSRPVYLPREYKWYDFWTNANYDGGTTLEANAALETMPLYVRMGSILLMTEVMQYADETVDAPYEVRVYAGGDASFELYEDAGDGYAYENGAFAIVRMTWNQARREFIIEARDGSFDALVTNRDYRIVLIEKDKQQARSFVYAGKKIRWTVMALGHEESEVTL
jgi:alpha-D-xyloside xylohydrolase